MIERIRKTSRLGMRGKVLVAFLMMVFMVVSGTVFASSASAINYTIEYKENVATNMPESVLGGLSPSASALLSNNSPLRTGFQFLGWCDQATTNTNGTDICASGHQHQPGGTVTLDAIANANNIKLYAMWEEVTYLQNLSADKCTTTMSTAIDSRDGTEYHIQRLADGKCWLLDNLALDLTNSTVLSGITQDNTNASNTTLGYLKGTTTGTTSDQYATAGVSNWTSSYSYSAPLVNMTNKDVIPTDATSTAGGYKVGGYYNYCAATAGSYCYGNGTSLGASSGNATEDICPKGWRMPTGNTSGEYSALANEIYGSTGSTSDATAYANYRSALRLPLSGFFYYSSADHQGSYGYWWSSTRYNTGDMYYLVANTSNIYPADDAGRSNGVSVRCVLGS